MQQVLFSQKYITTKPGLQYRNQPWYFTMIWEPRLLTGLFLFANEVVQTCIPLSITKT